MTRLCIALAFKEPSNRAEPELLYLGRDAQEAQDAIDEALRDPSVAYTKLIRTAKGLRKVNPAFGTAPAPEPETEEKAPPKKKTAKKKAAPSIIMDDDPDDPADGEEDDDQGDLLS